MINLQLYLYRMNISFKFIMTSFKHYNNKRINKRLEMTSDAPTNAGKHVTSNNNCARYTHDSVF